MPRRRRWWAATVAATLGALTAVTVTALPAHATDDTVARVQYSKNSVYGATNITSGNSGTLTTGATATNLLVLTVSVDKASGTITWPTGYTQVAQRSGASVSIGVATKVAAGGETSSGTFSWATGELGYTAVLTEYSGASGVNSSALAPATYSDTAVTSLSVDPPNATVGGLTVVMLAQDSLGAPPSTTDFQPAATNYTWVDTAGPLSANMWSPPIALEQRTTQHAANTDWAASTFTWTHSDQTQAIVFNLAAKQLSGNTAPTVNAGTDQTITLPNSANLSGSASDDGLPNPPGAITTAWSVVSGPGTVTFGNSAALATTATFSVDGTYTLRLTANDSVLSSTDDMVVTVNPAPSNTAPAVNAGTDQTVTLPAGITLAGTVTDDGLPNPPGTTTRVWAKSAGPGTVTFSDATTLTSAASFSVAGTYTLRLTATDKNLSAWDEMLVTVNPSGGGAGWTNIVDDQFNAGGVPTHWSLYDGPYGSSPNNCATPTHVSVSGGYMHMLMGWETSGTCGAAWYTAGMQISHDLGAVAQRVTLRWRVTGTDLTNVRSHRNIPMRWVDDPAFQWYQGESDFCEGSSLTGCSSFLHYANPGQIQHDYTVDVTQWHTMRFEQSNHVVKAYIDDLVTPVWTYTGDATTVPDAFRRAVLQQECQSSCPSSSFAGQTEDIQIDWIQVDNAS